MAQALRVFQDPSIVKNVPTTSAEQLQLATERKAAEMAAARAAASPPLISHPVQSLAVDSNGTPLVKSSGPTQAQQQALRSVSDALQVPGASGTTFAGKSQSRLTDTPSPILSFAGDEDTGGPSNPGLSAINNALVPLPRPRPTPPQPFLSGNPGVTDWSKISPDNGLYGIPAQGSATIPNRAPVMIPKVKVSSPSVMINGGGYQVQPGDTLAAIASRTGSSIQDIAAANNIANPNKIRAGVNIAVPPVNTGSVTIKAGDTLSQIAARNGTTVAALAAKNGIKDPNKIIAGASLKL